MAQDIAQVVADLLDAWNHHDAERAATFYAADYVGEDVAQAAPQHGPADRVRLLTGYVRAFPDLSFTGDTLVDGNRAVLVWVMRGTHQGKLMNIPATGRHVEVRGVSILTFEAGKITHGLNIWDTAGLLRALKLLPEL